MSLKFRITEDMKSALRARESQKLGAIRLLLAAVKQREIDERIELDDAQIVQVVEKLIKQRKDAASQFAAAGRAELAAAEQFEIEVLSAYMPEALSAEEIAVAVQSALTEAGAASPADMGKVMALLNPRLAGKADMAEVSRAARTALAKPAK
jgi:uncharacterized protein YqeY